MEQFVLLANSDQIWLTMQLPIAIKASLVLLCHKSLKTQEETFVSKYSQKRNTNHRKATVKFRVKSVVKSSYDLIQSVI